MGESVTWPNNSNRFHRLADAGVPAESVKRDISDLARAEGAISLVFVPFHSYDNSLDPSSLTD